MKCPRCDNEDPTYFYHGSKGWYCRKCISFGRAFMEESMSSAPLQKIQDSSEEYTLLYPLTDAQQTIAAHAVSQIFTTNVLIQAVCGAGKTEMVVPVISECLKRKLKIGFAIARRQVVLELQQRLQSYFPHAKVIAVCEGYTSVVDGDLIICTTHQLYRYYGAFEVLILDEPDAFPYRGNDVLHAIAKNSCRGHILYLTATPDRYLKKDVEDGKCVVYHLHSRPHGVALPVPKVRMMPMVLQYMYLYVWLKKHDTHPRIVFVPSIRLTNTLTKLFQPVFHSFAITSKTEDRDLVLQNYRNAKNGVLFATTVMERGVTIPDADVCVLKADHKIFDEAGLIQMAGRAGRNFLNPYGDILFLCGSQSESVQKCIHQIEEDNHAMSVMS